MFEKEMKDTAESGFANLFLITTCFNVTSGRMEYHVASCQESGCFNLVRKSLFRFKCFRAFDSSHSFCMQIVVDFLPRIVELRLPVRHTVSSNIFAISITFGTFNEQCGRKKHVRNNNGLYFVDSRSTFEQGAICYSDQVFWMGIMVVRRSWFASATCNLIHDSNLTRYANE